MSDADTKALARLLTVLRSNAMDRALMAARIDATTEAARPDVPPVYVESSREEVAAIDELRAVLATMPRGDR